MRNSRLALALACLGLFGCAHSRSVIKRDDEAGFGSYRAIGVPAFVDPRGQGQKIADAVNRDLAALTYNPVDGKVIAKILAQHKPSKDFGYSLETLQLIRNQTSADAVIIGRMSPDWSAAFVMMFETNMGEQVLRGIIRPSGRKKVFKNADEVALAVVKAITQ